MKNPEKASIEYKQEIKKIDLNILKKIQNIQLNFMAEKSFPMWCENTYGSIRDNMEGTDKIDMTKFILLH